MIKSIDWTYIACLASFACMEEADRPTDSQTDLSSSECECPEPCNCDHENE
jgi:hypothetical protein